MSNPLSLGVKTPEATASLTPQSASEQTDEPVLDATFAGLLQNEYAQLTENPEGISFFTDPLENSEWQILAQQLDENGNSLPEGEATQVSLFMAWQEPLNPLQGIPSVESKQTALVASSTLMPDSGIDTTDVSEKMIAASARITNQQTNNMENLVKAFMLGQAETSATDLPAKHADAELPTVQGQASSLGPITSTQARADTAVALPITIPPNRPEWGTAMGERLQWMVKNNIQSAEIRLDPPELGSIDVKITIHKDTAQVNFVAQHAQTRDALEQAIPRLREMLGETGLSLGDANVSQESFRQQHAGNEQQSDNPQGGLNGMDDGFSDGIDGEAVSGIGSITAKGSGLLDTYV